jgi:2-keto-4-pentenoate hydratase/2-oxohepta-3-ene-1,7-dioic acid hydratase in catechol pathway
LNTITLAGNNIAPGKIVCVGKNYLKHIREMGGDRPLAEPTIFMKPNSSVVSGRSEIEVPLSYGSLHHEVELCFVIGRECKYVSRSEAESVISGWGVGLDLTLRDIQSAAKKGGGPWTISKGFDSAAVFADFSAHTASFDPTSLEISLSVNGEVRQKADTQQMIFTPWEIIEYVSGYMTLQSGDVIMTGTPEGVGELENNDRVHAEITGLPILEVTVRRS